MSSLRFLLLRFLIDLMKDRFLIIIALFLTSSNLRLVKTKWRSSHSTELVSASNLLKFFSSPAGTS
ncbi:hypothetical protein HanXRQr2_Chr10g0430681 [Helianthus annuus]|uniref:Uncharacterized protein n=1 Tax=Helianthus annuus TaxID=4232 RepID=A0A9K3HVP2_HELAN|nr:hypothetical protein HanXRQr2_Chr10g0430681 [Helianthus annuus]